MPGSNFETCSKICDDLGSIIWYSAAPGLTQNDRNTVSDYVDILGNQEHPVVQVFFLNSDAIFQDDD